MEKTSECVRARDETGGSMMPVANLLAALHWSAFSLANACGVSERTAWRWKSGETSMPLHLVMWLTDLANYHNAHPAPARQENTVVRVFPVD